MGVSKALAVFLVLAIAASAHGETYFNKPVPPSKTALPYCKIWGFCTPASMHSYLNSMFDIFPNRLSCLNGLQSAVYLAVGVVRD